MNRTTGVRLVAATAGAALFMGVAGAAAADDEFGSGEVDVNVSISEISEPGALAMTVAGTEVSLAEDDSDPTFREFRGELPTVTITDTRTPDDIPEGAAWYVLGSSTDFVGDSGQADISAGHLGWAPRLIDGGESGLVAPGDEVETVLDAPPSNVGLVDQELFAIAADSGAIVDEAAWTATADLFLRTPRDVAPGSYSAKLTLSLFE